MSFFDKFPYTNFHELNLDWIISQLATVKDSMLKAVESAKEAALSAERALNHSNNARKSAEDAKKNADNAHLSEVNAGIYKDNASESEINAKRAELNAKASEDKAKISETNAKASEDKAKISETNAKASEDIAQEAETNASASATKAENIASTLTNWSELDTRLRTETKLREIQDNLRIKSATNDNNMSGNAFEIMNGGINPSIENVTIPPLQGEFNKYEYRFSTSAENDYTCYYAPVYMTIGRTALNLNAGTHSYNNSVPNIKRVLPINVPYTEDMILRLKAGYVFYVSTPNNTRTIYEMYPRTSSSFQLNSVELIPNVDASHDGIQVLINYTVGDNYANTHSETYIKLMFFVELYKKNS